MTGRLFILEGIDGCGKTTQLRAITQALIDEGITFKVQSMLPEGSIRQIVLFDPSLSPMQRLLLYKVAAETARLQVLRAMEQVEVVLIDRGPDTFVAYQGWGDGLLSEVQALNQLFPAFPKADLVFFLDVSVETSQARVRQAREELDVFEKRSTAFFENVRAGFIDQLDKHYPLGVRVDAEQPLTEVTESILSKIFSVLKIKRTTDASCVLP